MQKFVVAQTESKSLKMLNVAIAAIAIAVTLSGTSVYASEEGKDIALPKEIVVEPLKTQPVSSHVPVADPVNGATLNLPMTGVSDGDKSVVPFVTQDFSREDILNDRANRIAEPFHVSPTLSKRVGFWFDIYTRFGSNVRVIHDADHPWIVYNIIDTSETLALPVKTHNKVTPFIRANAQVKTAKLAVLKTLKSLLKKTKHEEPKLTDEESRLAGLLDEVEGKRKNVYAAAVRGLRSQVGQRDFYKSGVIASARYLSRMEESFAKYDLPIELTRIPLVESSFNENAVSKVGASGIWQFMPHVGKHFLYMDAAVDERNSPLKATEAAAQLLLQNFRIFKNWPLAITAYNHGSGGIRRAMRQLKTDDFETILDKYHNRSFQFASANYYASYLAALHAERYETEVFGPLRKVDPLMSDTIQLAYKMKAAKIVKVAGMTMEELRLYNPDLKIKGKSGNFFLHKGYALHLPEGRGARIELFHLQAQDYLDKKGTRRKHASLRADATPLSTSIDGKSADGKL